jgi:hypothetical protein
MNLSLIMTKIVALNSCDNMYIMESKDELILVDFFVHLIPLVICD